MQPFFKIIIPNYNNSKYLRNCLDSIKNQTYKNYICIVVDDMSTDNSVDIIEEYVKNDSEHFVLLKSKKKMYGGCRNLALKYNVPSVKFNIFVDSDDWILREDYFEMAKEKIDEDDCEHLFVQTDRFGIKIKPTFEHIILSGSAPWRHIVTTKYDYIKFSTTPKMNDVIRFLRIMDICNKDKISFLESNKPYYHYNTSSNNSFHNSYKKYSNDSIRSEKNILKEISKLDFKDKYVIEKAKMICEKEIIFKNTDYKDINLNRLFENSFVITVDKNQYLTFVNIFEKTHKGLPVPKLFKGYVVNNTSSTYGCMLSHYNAVKKAKELDLPYVLIFEDDAYPCENIVEYLNNVIGNIPKDADVVLLGYVSCVFKKHRKVLLKSGYNYVDRNVFFSISGAHSYIIFKSGYDRYLNYVNERGIEKTVADRDVMYSTGNKCYLLDKPLYIQYTTKPSMHSHFGFSYPLDNGMSLNRCDTLEIPSGFSYYDSCVVFEKDCDNSEYRITMEKSNVKLDYTPSIHNYIFKGYFEELPQNICDYNENDAIYLIPEKHTYILEKGNWKSVVIDSIMDKIKNKIKINIKHPRYRYIGNVRILFRNG